MLAYQSDLIVPPKTGSTVLSMAPPRISWTSAAASLVKVTLSAIPGAPVGSQLPAVDQSVSPAVPDHDLVCANDGGVKPITAITTIAATTKRIAVLLKNVFIWGLTPGKLGVFR